MIKIIEKNHRFAKKIFAEKNPRDALLFLRAGVTSASFP